MLRRFGLSFVVAVFLGWMGPSFASDKIRQELDQVVPLEFSHHTLQEVVERLRASTGLAFELDGKLTEEKIRNAEGQIPSPPEGPLAGGYSCSLENLKLRTALSTFLGYYGLDYAVLDETVVIATADRARDLQTQQPVDVAVDKVKLSEVLAQLSRQTGTEIVLHPRASTQADKQITLHTQSMALDKVTALLAELAELKAVAWEKTILVTTPNHAAAIHSEKRSGGLRSEQPKQEPATGLSGGLGIGGGFGLVGGAGFGGGVAGLSVDPTPVADRGPVRRASNPDRNPTEQSPAPSQKKKKVKSESAQLRKALSEMIEAKDFQNPMLLKEAMALLHENLLAKGVEVPILVNVDAFREENPDAEPIYETQIDFPPYPKKIPLGAALRVILSKVRTNNATYLVRPTYIEVLPYFRSQAEAQTVEGTFIDRPLTEVLQDLSDQTGISIVVDARAGQRALTKVTASLPPDTGLMSAVQVFADMADLKVMKVDNLLYVTLRSNNADFPPSERPPRVRRLDAAAE